MKHLALILCIVGVVALTGCENDDFEDAQDDMAGNGDMTDDGGMGDGDVANLQTFVVNNCNDAPAGDPVNSNGASFPDSSVTDPEKSVYTRNCLNTMG